MLSRPFAVLCLSAALAAAPARGQLVEGESIEADVKKSVSKLADDKPLDDAAAARLKEKFLSCKKTGDCKPYLKEKELYKKKKPKDDPAAEPEPLSGTPAPEGGRRKPPPPGTGLAAPPEDPAGRAIGEPSAGPPPPAGQEEARREEAGQRRERVAGRAAGAADAIRRSFLPADETAGPGGDGPQRRPGPGGAEARTAYSAEPRSVQEMALAARTGYAATFRDHGLKVGAGSRGEPAILRDDGSPASPADLARLRTALGEEPEAPRRRPDFFQVLPREKFADLKNDFAARPALRASVFRDIGMTASRRDFQWSVTCSGLSGSCNPHAGQGAYRKGQDVAPEDLDSAWTAAQEEISASDGDEEEFGEYTEEDRRQAEAADLAAERLTTGRRLPLDLAGLLARMGDMARTLGGNAGEAPASAPPSSVATAVPASGADAFSGRAGDSPRASVELEASNASRTAPPEAARPFVPPGERTAVGRHWLWIVAGAGLLLIGLRRRLSR